MLTIFASASRRGNYGDVNAFFLVITIIIISSALPVGICIEYYHRWRWFRNRVLSNQVLLALKDSALTADELEDKIRDNAVSGKPITWVGIQKAIKKCVNTEWVSAKRFDTDKAWIPRQKMSTGIQYELTHNGKIELNKIFP